MKPIDSYIITTYARRAIARRGLSEDVVRSVLAGPEQRIRVRIGRDVLQSHTNFGGSAYLLRVFVDVDRNPAEVVTAYRTSKIAKYWRLEP
jgi:hypothetical protein